MDLLARQVLLHTKIELTRLIFNQKTSNFSVKFHFGFSCNNENPKLRFDRGSGSQAFLCEC